VNPELREALRSAAKLLGLAAADLKAAANALERAGIRQSIGKLRHVADDCDRDARRFWLRAGSDGVRDE